MHESTFVSCARFVFRRHHHEYFWTVKFLDRRIPWKTICLSIKNFGRVFDAWQIFFREKDEEKFEQVTTRNFPFRSYWKSTTLEILESVHKKEQGRVYHGKATLSFQIHKHSRAFTNLFISKITWFISFHFFSFVYAVAYGKMERKLFTLSIPVRFNIFCPYLFRFHTHTHLLSLSKRVSK